MKKFLVSFKNQLILFLKGFAVGIANLPPGFSGGTMAVAVGIYDLFIYGFAHIFDSFVDVIKKCFSLYFGMACGIVFGLFTIKKLLEVIPFVTIMFFIGLVIGTIPFIYKKAKAGKVTVKDIVGLVFFFAFLIVLPLITGSTTITMYSVVYYIVLFVLGAICAAAMVIPGVSGTLLLMAFGFYFFLTDTLPTFLKNLVNFSMENYWDLFFSVAIFAIGAIVGIIFISKMIEKAIAKYPKTVYFSILGILFASPFSMIYTSNSQYNLTFDVLTIVFSIVSFVFGLVLIMYLHYRGEKNSKKEETSNETSEN